MKAVCYMRVSTKNQEEKSTIDIQRNEIEKYCTSNNIDLVARFQDNGVSGAVESRAGLAEMYDYLEIHNIKTIIIFSLDRLSRELRIQENILHDLQQKDIQVSSVKEPDLGSQEAERVLMRQILGSFSQFEKSKITLRLSLGRLNKSRKGQYAGGRPAFGYTAKEKELVIDSDKAKVIKSIFYMRNRKKMSYYAVAKELNRRGVKTAESNSWHTNSVRQIILNKTYKGLLQYKENTTKRRDLALV